MQIYKDGNTTQRASANGITATTSFDSNTGLNLITIDLSDNTTAGFYAAGSDYLVAVADVTIDSQTVRFWAGAFSIERSGGVLALVKAGNLGANVTQWNGTNVSTPSTAGIPEVNVKNIANSAVSTSSAQIGVNVVNAAGTAWNSGAIGASTLASDTIAAAKIATGAITSAKFAAGAIDAAAIADNAIDAGAIAADAITAAKIANGAIDAATFAADVDAEILSYLVDDATRIDASALNTLSGHDPGETIMGATDLGTGSGLTSLATAAELAKVPKSDSNVTWNATAAAQIQSEANDALVAYDPPTKAELDSAVAPLATSAALATVDGNVDDILADTADMQPKVDALPTLAEFFTADSGETYGDAVAGSVVKEIADNAGGSSLTASDIADEVETRTIAGVTTVSTVNALANNSVTAAALATDAVTEIQSGLATAAALATVDTVVDAIKAKTDGLPADPVGMSWLVAITGSPSVSLADDIAAVQTAADAIKAKTDNLPTDPADASVIAGRFDTIDATLGTPAGASLAEDISNIAAGSGPTVEEIGDELETRTLMADIRKVNNIAVNGTGTEANPWGP